MNCLDITEGLNYSGDNMFKFLVIFTIMLCIFMKKQVFVFPNKGLTETVFIWIRSILAVFLLFCGHFITNNRVPKRNCSYHSIFFRSYGCVKERVSSERSYSGNSVNISDCFFNRTSAFASEGGVIYLSGGDYYMEVSFCTFYYCLSTNGGAIYFYSMNSNLKMICAKSCSSSYNNHFALIRASQNNAVDHMSISNCSFLTEGHHSFHLFNGIISIRNYNSSMNNAYLGSGLAVWSPSSFSFSYSTFSNNNVSNGVCIYFSNNNGIMSFSNIIQNNSPMIYGVVFIDGGTPSILYSIFKMNKNTLFYISSGSLSLSHSFINHTGYTTSGNNNSLTDQQTYQINFYNSHYCMTDILQQTQTVEITRCYTPNLTIGITIPMTFQQTPIETLPRTFYEYPIEFNQQCTKPNGIGKEISIVFSFSFVLPFFHLINNLY